MPNWTKNHLTIKGDEVDINSFINDITLDDDTFSLTNINPCPKEINNISQGSLDIDGVRCDAWYEDEDGKRPVMDFVKDELTIKYGTYKPLDWQYMNWGTKWGDIDTEVIDSDNSNECYITFESAWNEPFMLLNDIANKYNLQINNQFTIEFNEGGVTNYPWTPEDADRVYSDHQNYIQEVTKMF